MGDTWRKLPTEEQVYILSSNERRRLIWGYTYLNKDKNYFSKSRGSFKNSPSQESREEWKNLELAGMPENGRES